MYAIEFENVGKQYRLGLVSTGTISHDLNRWWTTHILGKEDPYLKIGETNDRSSKGNSEYVWALKDINFKVEQGDVVGIIGKNGAGKSTLLKLLSRVTAPTTGCIRARGRIASLLEVGTGFHPEMTGRENIYLNGAIMGMTKQEISRKIDEIVDFSGCERYIDTPVKRYSSGMTVRLGFAVAAHLEPEILVVDEVLAVGDLEFQKKAIGKMGDVANSGRTILFVSHNMNSVKLLCKNAIVLKNGRIDYSGTAEDCVNYYSENNIESLVSHTIISQKNREGVSDKIIHDVEFIEATLLNEEYYNISTDEPIEIEAKLRKNNKRLKESQFTVLISNSSDIRVLNYISNPVDLSLYEDYFTIRMKLSYHGLPKGKYNVQLATGIKNFATGTQNYDVVKDVLSFEIKKYKKNIDKEYLEWNKNWALVLHDQELIDISIL